MRNPFTKTAYDRLEDAHGLVDDAIGVFHRAADALDEAVSHYNAVEAEALAASEALVARAQAASKAGLQAAAVRDKIDALTTHA